MFKVKIGEDEYKVRFEHYIPKKADRINWIPEEFKLRFGTICRISRNHILSNRAYPEDIVEGADLSPKDNFNRNIGRKISLTRALQSFSKDQRKLFWDAYFKVRGGKW